MVGHRTVNAAVAGSSPAIRAILLRLRLFRCVFGCRAVPSAECRRMWISTLTCGDLNASDASTSDVCASGQHVVSMCVL